MINTIFLAILPFMEDNMFYLLLTIFISTIIIDIVLWNHKYKKIIQYFPIIAAIIIFIMVGYQLINYSKNKGIIQNGSSQAAVFESNKDESDPNKPNFDNLIDKYVTKSSHGKLKLVSFSVESSKPIEIFGHKGYDCKGIMTIETLQDVYKKGSSMMPHWSSLYCYDKEKNQNMYGWNSIDNFEFYPKGKTVRVQSIFHFSKTDQGWEVPKSHSH